MGPVQLARLRTSVAEGRALSAPWRRPRAAMEGAVQVSHPCTFVVVILIAPDVKHDGVPQLRRHPRGTPRAYTGGHVSAEDSGRRGSGRGTTCVGDANERRGQVVEGFWWCHRST